MPVSYCRLHLKDEMWLKIQVIDIGKVWQKYLFLSLPFIKCIRHDYSLWNLEVVVSRYSDLEAALSLKLVQKIKGPHADKKNHHTSCKPILLLCHRRMVGCRRNVFKGKNNNKQTPTMKYLMCLNMSRGNLHFWQTVWGWISERIIEGRPTTIDKY